MTTTHVLEVDGAHLHYEVRGSGSPLLVLGSPMDAAAFAPLAEVLAEGYTVITHDPRGISLSTLDDAEQESTPELRAADVAALLDALGVRSANVFGTSGGALTGLALAIGYPGRVRTLIAHEPPTVELLPDAAEQQAQVEDIVDTFRREGLGAAWARFMANAGYANNEEGPESPSEPSLQDIRNGERFFGHELLASAHYLPDIAALTSGPTRIRVGVGAKSGRLLTYRTSLALAELLHNPPVEFPGDHSGFLGAPDEFAAVVRDVLANE